MLLPPTGASVADSEVIVIEAKREQESPLNGYWTVLSVLVAIILGLGSLLFFLTPNEIAESFKVLQTRHLLLSLAFFFLGCLVTVERWRACLAFRATRKQAFHSMGVANAGNLLIFGRIGEPLRIYLLSRVGVPAEFGTSAVVQERLGDQCLRIVFIGTTIFLSGMGGGGHLAARLLTVTAVTVAFGAFLAFLVKFRKAVSTRVGNWLGRLPRLKSKTISKFLLTTLADLAESWF